MGPLSQNVDGESIASSILKSARSGGKSSMGRNVVFREPTMTSKRLGSPPQESVEMISNKQKTTRNGK